MKKSALLAALFGLMAMGVTTAQSADKKPVDKKMPAMSQDSKMSQDQAMMDAKMAEAMKLGSPGENHKVLDNFAGNWSYAMSFWMSPDGKPLALLPQEQGPDAVVTEIKRWAR